MSFSSSSVFHAWHAQKGLRVSRRPTSPFIIPRLSAAAHFREETLQTQQFPPTGTDSAKERARHAMEAHKERREQLRKDEEETSESGEDGHRVREIKGTDGSVA